MVISGDLVTVVNGVPVIVDWLLACSDKDGELSDVVGAPGMGCRFLKFASQLTLSAAVWFHPSSNS